MKQLLRSKLSRVLVLGLVVCLLASLLVLPTSADTNAAVNEAKNGVLQVNLVYRDDGGNEIKIGSGSGFLINEKNVVTCAHVVNINDLTDEDCQTIIGILGVNESVAKFRSKLGYSVTITRDVTVKATIETMSVDMDFAILTLAKSINNVTPLPLRLVNKGDNPVQQTETVYSIGFPDESSQVATVTTYISDDATITQGEVNKIAMGKNLYSHKDTNYLQTSCKLTAGNSGGPMVDKNGAVIGICEGATGDGVTDDYFYAVVIDQVVEVCDKLGIAYTPAGGSAPAPSSEPTSDTTTEPAPATVNTDALQSAIDRAAALKADDFSKESYQNLQTAVQQARAALTGSQSDVDAALANLNAKIEGLEKAGPNTMLIILIAAAAAIVLVIIIVVIVLSSNKKKKAAANVGPTGFTPPAPPVAPAGGRPGNGGFTPPQPPVAPNPGGMGTYPLNPDAGETTILSQGAGETTVLSRNVNGGTLVRSSNQERIAINKEELVIGRERKRVDYCISDNTSISRMHAKLVVRNGQTYLVDMNAANGTFINGSKAAPYQEMALKDGDKITLAAEDFTYHA